VDEHASEADTAVAVVGAGAVGTTVAYDLTRRGADVVVYEREAVAAGASGCAAGLCYDADADRLDARVAARAMERFGTLSGSGFTFTACPYVWLARESDRRRADVIREQVPRMRERGRDVALIDPTDLAAAFPDLRTGDVAAAAVARSAGYADPAAYARTMAVRAEAAGAEVREGSAARLASDGDGDGPAVLADGDRRPVDAVVVAAGAHTRRVVAPVAPLPLKAYRVQAAVTDGGPAEVPMLFDATGSYYLRPHREGLLVGDGTVPEDHDPDGYEREADATFIADCDDDLERALAADPPAVDRAWAGLCTATPDGDPLLGEVADGVFVAAGWHGHGFMRAPATGEAVADLVLGRDPLDGIERFSPARFDGDEEFPIVEGMDAALE
jgi:sarcosine oxidase subunit beta